MERSEDTNKSDDLELLESSQLEYTNLHPNGRNKKRSKSFRDSVELYNSMFAQTSSSAQKEDKPELEEEPIEINCRKVDGWLHKSKLGSGANGKCIFVTDCQRWFTPLEFMEFTGLKRLKVARNWRRGGIYADGQPLLNLIQSGQLKPHIWSCKCRICTDDENSTERIKYEIRQDVMLPDQTE